MAKKRKKPRYGRLYPPPAHSDRFYVRLDPADIAVFRFLLEAHDNLGLFTVADRQKGVLMVRHSPHQRHEMDEFFESIKGEIAFEVVYDPRDPPRPLPRWQMTKLYKSACQEIE